MRDPEDPFAIDAKSPFEAKVMTSVLAAAGIPASVEGELLADEVAVAQASMHTGGVRVLVPRSERDAAFLAIENARRAARDLPLMDDTESTPWSVRYRRAVRVFVIVVAIAVLTFGAEVIQMLYS